MHLPKIAVAGLSVFGPGRTIPSGQVPEQATIQERSGSLERRILPEGCVPVLCHQPASPASRDSTAEIVPDVMEPGCIPKLLECTGPNWVTFENNPVLISWGTDPINHSPFHLHGPFSLDYDVSPDVAEDTDRPEGKATAVLDKKQGPVSIITVTQPPSTQTRTHYVVQHFNDKSAEAVEKRSDDDGTVYVWGTTRMTVKGKPTAAVAKREDDEEPVEVEITTSILYPPIPEPTIDIKYEPPARPMTKVLPAAAKRQTETVYGPTHYVIEATYVNDKKSNIIPTPVPEPSVKLGRPVILHATEQNIVIPSNAPRAIHPHGGRFKPTPVANHPPTTMKQVVRRDQLFQNSTLDVSPPANDAPHDIAAPLICEEHLSITLGDVELLGSGLQGPVAYCRFDASGDARGDLFSPDGFLAIGVLGQYSCQTIGGTWEAPNLVGCVDLCSRCDATGGSTCRDQCPRVTEAEKNDKKKRNPELTPEYKYVVAGAKKDERGVDLGMWCPPKMIWLAERDICI